MNMRLSPLRKLSLREVCLRKLYLRKLYPPKLYHLLLFAMLYWLGFPAAMAQQVGDLLWEENFNRFDVSRWNKAQGDGCAEGICGWGNQELQSYAPENASIEPIPGEANNHALVLQAQRQSRDGLEFTSARVNSQGKVAVHYGMIEARIRVPDLQLGLWPAFWLLGTTSASWPAKGEIDMMEMGHSRAHIDAFHPGANLNSYVGANLIFYADAACNEGNPSCAASTAWQVDNAYVANEPIKDRFLVYRLYWTEEQIRFSVVDGGVEHFMYAQPFVITEESAEFRQPFYLLMNMAVGGNFTDASRPDQVSAPLPAKMYIDYIRVYELDGQGSVQQGAAAALSGELGVFTETSPSDTLLQPGQDSDIYVWSVDALSGGSEAPWEGSEVISWRYTSPGSWFGGGIMARQPLNLSQFDQGSLRFKIKMPADVDFRVGITDTFNNQFFVDFPANQSRYGLQRDGEWGEASIAIADLRGAAIALESIAYPFAILSVDGSLPSSRFDFAIDDIVWSQCRPSCADSSSSSTSSSSTSTSNSSSGSTSSSSSSSSSSGSSSSGGSTRLYGVRPIDATNSVEFFVNSSAWADVHYRINGGTQLNVRMVHSAAGNRYLVDNLQLGDELSYYFTYWDPQLNGAVDTQVCTTTFGGN